MSTPTDWKRPAAHRDRCGSWSCRLPGWDGPRPANRYGLNPETVVEGVRRGWQFHSLVSRQAHVIGSQDPANAPGDPRRGVLDRVTGKASVPNGSLHLRVTQQFADHREALAERQRPRSMQVLQVVEPDILVARALSNEIPEGGEADR